MNKIEKLLDEKYVKDFFKGKVLPLYPDFSDIKKIRIKLHKELIWEYTYHVVIEFSTIFLTNEGKQKTLPIFCSAHSEEPRKNVYDILKFLWQHDFSKGYLSIPHPLFYSDYFRGTFYRGVKGDNLYQYIRDRNFGEIELIVFMAAAWFAKLHRLKNVENIPGLNKDNERIETIVPGVNHILYRIDEMYPHYSEIYKKIYTALIDNEDKFLSSTTQRWLVHGDAHPENIIKMGRKKIAIIDFTDFCLSDFARDIGSFLQQLEFMCNRKIGDPVYAEKVKKLFLENYLKNAKINLDESLRERIDNYYSWTAMRTATFFLIKSEPEPDRAKPLIETVAKKLGIEL